jgi:hypothetical protein
MTVVTLVLCAMCVSAAIFLIEEMYQPFIGIIHVSSVPMRDAYEQLGR